FRNQLFKNSESFITNQANSIVNYNIVYLGRKRLGTNSSNNMDMVISDLKGKCIREKEIWNVVFNDPYPYLRLVKDLELHLIHAHFAIDSLYALPLAKTLKIPLVTTLHGFDVTTKRMDFLRSGSPSWINYSLYSEKLKNNGDLFLCVSDYIREKAISNGFPEEKTIKHYIGIKIDHNFVDSNKDRTILHIARLVEKKGTTYLIDAIKKIENHLDGFVVNIVGDGPLFNELKGKIESLGLDRHIKMLGEIPHEQVMNLVKTSSMLIVPSVTAKSGDSEGLPTVILEASANQVPVIGTYHAGIPEAIRDEVTGYLIDEKDINALGERIEFLIQNENLRNTLGKNARNLMCEKFDLDKQSFLLEQEYERLINEK
ncbi:TPA: glycosyltransferase, partial [Escherichia coli]